MTLAFARPDRRAQTIAGVQAVPDAPNAATDHNPRVRNGDVPQQANAPEQNPAAGRAHASRTRRRAMLLVVVLGVLSALGPLATDLYLPALPQIASDLGTSEASVKLTLTSVMAGLALGQLVLGPLSDRWGRRLPLLTGIGVFTVSTVGIAMASSVEMFSLLRFVQGLSAAAGLVVSRAIVRDVFDGDAAATFFSRLVLLSGLAPMLGPVLGGQLLFLGPWQLLFAVLGAMGLVTFALVLFGLPESLPAEQREPVSPREQMRVFGGLLRDVRFIGPTLTLALSFGMSFTYISTFSFVSQSRFGASAQEFSLVFAVTTLGMIIGNQVNAFLISRMEIHRRLFLGLVGSILSVAVLAALGASGGADLVTVTAALFAMMVFTGLVSPNATALALDGQPPKIAGSGSALLGTLQFGIGSGLAATAGLSGPVTLSSMTGVMLATAVAAAVVFVGFTARVRRTLVAA
ncbi:MULTISPECIES: multidrug effflux MFS transporter [unclassified Nocardiopsis]|uniref:multidrug effflux MFS transporter n=1 Tax=unclassified Nocardiopsis TaxID=2649073 RepID=UPI001359A04A|nr:MULTISPECIES: multidrug effflux MFS transporter [unclassified Nocardiopsis]